MKNSVLSSSLKAALVLAGVLMVPVFALSGAETPAEIVDPQEDIQADPGPQRPLRQTRYAPSRFILSNTPHEALVIPGIDQPLTARYIHQYSSPGGLAWLNSVMERGKPYLGFIRREIRERNLPPELLYLPVIESAYLPTAVSRSGAAGLWQFMRNSIGPFDIRVTEWMDERMDFWKSTVGALRKLEENYRYFEDWPLALAAYNAGMGAVSRLVNRTEIKDYWELSEQRLLKNETIHYVPKLLAVAYILSHPRKFGLPMDWSEDPGWTRVRVGKTVNLDLLAEYAAINSRELKRANQELFYSVTPPDPGYHLKVRAADVPAVTEVLGRTDLKLINYYFHTVQSGDTLSALSRHYGVSVDQILSSNPGVQPRYLRIGARLIIPALKEVGPYQRSRRTDANLSFTGSHLVKRGESFWSIAMAYDVDPAALAEANGMGLNDILREGKILKTPVKD
jgi:membrane-bound lytic murein transglycosylase D